MTAVESDLREINKLVKEGLQETILSLTPNKTKAVGTAERSKLTLDTDS